MLNTQILTTTNKRQPYGHYDQSQGSKMAIVSFTLIIHLFRILLSGLAWMVSNNSSLASQLTPFMATFHESTLYNIVFFMLISIKVLVILVIYLRSDMSKNVFLQKIIMYLIIIFRQYKQLDLVFTTCLLAVNGMANIIPFCLSLFLQCYDMIFFQDFIVRKSLGYARSIRSYFFYRVYVISIYVIDAVTIHLQTALIYNACFFGVAFLFLVRFSIGKMRIMGLQTLDRMIGIELFVYVSMFYSVCSHWSEVQFSFNILCQCFFIVFFLFLYSQLKKHASWVELCTKPNSNIKQYELYLTSFLLQQQKDSDMNVLTQGMLIFHSLDKCPNPSCFAKKQTVYDSLTNEEISTSSSSHKASLVKMHLQCLYEKGMAKSVPSNQNIFDYCEFLYNESGNKTKLMTLLHSLKNEGLDGIERIIYNKFQLLISAYFRTLNESQYEGNLPFETLIEQQERIVSIQERIETYLLRNSYIWTLFGKSQVEVGLIREQFIANMKIVEELDEEWKVLGCFVNASREWKRLYFNYILFVKNQKIKNKQLQEVKSPLPAKNIDHFNQPNSGEIFNMATLFDHNSIFFKAILYQKQLIITNVCLRFQEKTGYDSQALSNCELDFILPEELAKVHNERVSQWMDESYQAHESSYLVKESELVTKQGEKLPVVKLFKMCYSIENGLQFVCFLLVQDQSNHNINNHTEEIFYGTGQTLAIDSMSRNKCNQSPSKIRQVNQSNIFLKEQSTHTQQQDYLITRFLNLGRALSLTAFICLSLTLVTISTNNSNLIAHSNQFITLMHVYRLPIILNINYLKSSLKMGNKNKVSKTITTNTNTLLSYVSDPLTISAIFDPQINQPRMYNSDGGYAQFANVSYNQIDLFYTIASSIMSLSKGAVNRTSKEYTEFSTFLKPAYDNMINGTKNRLHYTFKTLIKDSQNNQIYILVSGVVTFVVLFIVMLVQLAYFFKRMMAVASIIKDFPERHVEIIWRYCKDVRLHFLALALSQRSAATVLHKSDIVNVRNGKDDNLNKKPKTLLERKSKHCSSSTIVRVVFSITSTITISLLITLVLFNLSSIDNISKFEETGFYFLRYFPTGPIITMGALEKYYSLTDPQQKLFNASKYDDVISSMDIFGNFPYIGSSQDNSLYLQKQKNYFFGNPCTYNPSLLTVPDVSVSTCLTISNGTFSQGISSYLRYSQRLASSYIRGETNMTASEVNEYTVSVTILTVYVLDAISTWITEFIQKVQDFHNVNISVVALIFSVIWILHVVANEWIIKAILRREHQFAMQLYRHYVPEFLLQEEKVIRQRFIIEGLIGKD